MNQELTSTPSEGDLPAEPKQRKLTDREKIYIRGIIEGKTRARAARDAGFSETIANSRVHEWIREDRKDSSRPHLWDEYHRLMRRVTRMHDVTVANVLNELKIIAFSSIDKFIDFPTREEAEREARKELNLQDVFGGGTATKPKIQAGQTPEEIKEIIQQYRAGSEVKFKFKEDIPECLWPAIAEFSTSNGEIKIKFYNKLDAIEKLCRYLKMYEPEAQGNGDILNVQNITIVVNGTRSPLMGGPPPVRRVVG